MADARAEFVSAVSTGDEDAGESIYLLGGGGHASDVLNLIERLGRLDAIRGCFDDSEDLPRMQRWGVPRLGPLRHACVPSGRFALGLGMPSTKAAVLGQIDVDRAQPISLVDPAAMVGHGASIGEGVVVFAGARISALCKVGHYAFVGHNVPIGHDSVIGARASIMPGAALSGDCVLGEDVLIGSNAVVLQGVAIGDGAVVGAGAVVTSDVAPGETVVGSPARPLTARDA